MTFEIVVGLIQRLPNAVKVRLAVKARSAVFGGLSGGEQSPAREQRAHNCNLQCFLDLHPHYAFHPRAYYNTLPENKTFASRAAPALRHPRCASNAKQMKNSNRRAARKSSWRACGCRGRIIGHNAIGGMKQTHHE